MTTYRGRRAATLENASLRVTVLEEGGQVAEILHKGTGVNPLWTPPWPSIEPSTFTAAARTRYGDGVDATLLAGIMGHNLCLDIFGAPSSEEEGAGMPVHGEATLVRYEIARDARTFSLQTRCSPSRSCIWSVGSSFGRRRCVSASGCGTADLRRFTEAPASSAYTAHLMDPARDDPFSVAFTPGLALASGYVSGRADFPWLGIWEENHSRAQPPWNGETLTRGLEFGVSPFPEPRRAMIDRGRLFGFPTYRWIPAGGRRRRVFRGGQACRRDPGFAPSAGVVTGQGEASDATARFMTGPTACDRFASLHSCSG